MAVYVPEEPQYNEYLDKQITNLIGVSYDIIAICKTAHKLTENTLWGTPWYYWRNEIRRMADALSLLEHDAFLFAEQVTRLSEDVWKLYYKEHPDTTSDVPVTDPNEWAEMRSHYFD